MYYLYTSIIECKVDTMSLWSNVRTTKLIAYPFQFFFKINCLQQYGTSSDKLLLNTSVSTCIPYKEWSHRVPQCRPPCPDSADWSGAPAFLARNVAESFEPTHTHIQYV